MIETIEKLRGRVDFSHDAGEDKAVWVTLFCPWKDVTTNAYGPSLKAAFDAAMSKLEGRRLAVEGFFLSEARRWERGGMKGRSAEVKGLAESVVEEVLRWRQRTT